VVCGILDMREGKHVLHFMVGDEVLPHAIVNIPNKEKTHFGVSQRVFNLLYYYFLYVFILLLINL
jgi:hypothetical protein